jgi:hypothetical protein
MTDAERIERIRSQSVSLHGGGYHYPNSGVPSEACYDIRFLLEQLDKATFALQQLDGPCPRCAEEDQHRAEAEDGMRNAAEIAGLQ